MAAAEIPLPCVKFSRTLLLYRCQEPRLERLRGCLEFHLNLVHKQPVDKLKNHSSIPSSSPASSPSADSFGSGDSPSFLRPCRPWMWCSSSEKSPRIMTQIEEHLPTSTFCQWTGILLEPLLRFPHYANERKRVSC